MEINKILDRVVRKYIHFITFTPQACQKVEKVILRTSVPQILI